MPQPHSFVPNEHQPAAYPQDSGARSLFGRFDRKTETAVLTDIIPRRAGSVFDTDGTGKFLDKPDRHCQAVVAKICRTELNRLMRCIGYFQGR